MDQLSYKYNPNKPNQLTQVKDAVNPVQDAEDIETQQANNYQYNAIGQLVKNKTVNITYIYNTSGLEQVVLAAEEKEEVAVEEVVSLKLVQE